MSGPNDGGFRAVVVGSDNSTKEVGTVTRKMTYKVGDRVRCYQPAPDGATGTVVKVEPRTSSPYKVRFDRPNPFTGEQPEVWVQGGNVMGEFDTEFNEPFRRRAR